ncbi:hypothetical protein HMPREF1199_00548 [Hoylesella oralis CC98A]|nr:hypothetical protein HMPREF1199_00548 [Hoylesella oralis CC98A]
MIYHAKTNTKNGKLAIAKGNITHFVACPSGAKVQKNDVKKEVIREY